MGVSFGLEDKEKFMFGQNEDKSVRENMIRVGDRRGVKKSGGCYQSY